GSFEQSQSSGGRTPLPRASSGSSFANALPRPTGSNAGPLPRRTSSVVTPPPIPAAAKSVARPLPQKPTPPKKKEEVLEVSDADLVEEPKDDETKLDDGLEFEWAPVPAVPGLGR
ncbi:MAG TPA: hypothetical protein VF334_21695, partial [Polyangia bacterium]